MTIVQTHESRRTYVVMKQNPEEALAAIKEMFTGKTKVYLVGGLSRNMVRRMKLKPDDLRLI